MMPFADDRFVAGLAAVFGWSVVPVDTSSGMRALSVERRTGPFREIVVPPYSPYSAIQDPDHAGPVGLLELASRIMASGRPALLALSPELSGSMDQLPGFERREMATYVLTTASADVVLEHCSSSQRRLVRKHADEFVYRSKPDDLEAVVQLVAASYGRHGRTMPGGTERMTDLASYLVSLGMASVHTVVDRTTDEVAAGIVALRGDATAWYWLSGSIPGPAMSVLIPRTAEALHTDGINQFDLMGANTPSIAEFKRRFGADLVSYAHFRTPGRGVSSLISGLRNRMRP